MQAPDRPELLVVHYARRQLLANAAIAASRVVCERIENCAKGDVLRNYLHETFRLHGLANAAIAASRASAHANKRRFDCDEYHEMSHLGAAGEPIHGDEESGTPLCRHQRLDGPRWLEWRKSMGSSDEVRELRDDEIDSVNGGLVVIAIIAVLIGLLVPAVQ